MGLHGYDIRFVLSAQQMGCSLKEICTLGRMSLHATPREIESVLREYDRFTPRLWDRFDRQDPIPFADDVLEFIDEGQVTSIDFSEYESASILHDLNQPIPEHLQNRFDMVIDGGTMEHVFNYPTALANAMRMVKVGGHLFLKTPCNNLCGHGFYQFSPELYFRALTPENGYELLRMYVSGKGTDEFYHVVDPQIVHGRVMLLESDASVLLVHARKIADVEPFSKPPLQSDYVSIWDDAKEDVPAEHADGRLKATLRRYLDPEQIRMISLYLNRYRQWQHVRRWRKESRLSNRRLYKPVSDWNVTTASITGTPMPMPVSSPALPQRTAPSRLVRPSVTQPSLVSAAHSS
jgi:hypothetical protein